MNKDEWKYFTQLFKLFLLISSKFLQNFADVSKSQGTLFKFLLTDKLHNVSSVRDIVIPV